MTEIENTEAHVPITISIDVESLLKSELSWSVASDPFGDPEEVPGGNGRIIDIVTMKLAAAIQPDVLKVVREAVRDKVLDKVDDLIDEVMDGTIRLTSEYGEPKSPETTIREAMIKAVTERLESRVDRDGKRFDGRGYGTSQSYLQWRAEKTASDVLDKELSGKLSQAAKDIKERATDIVSKKIAEVLGRGF